VLAPLRNRKFFSLAEANVAIAEQLAMVNGRPFVVSQSHAARCSTELERAVLQPLPSVPFELATWKSAR